MPSLKTVNKYQTRSDSAYREIARTSGVIMIATAAGKRLPHHDRSLNQQAHKSVSSHRDAFNMIDQGAGRDIKWDGYHIFKLNLLKMALLQWNDPASTTLMFTASFSSNFYYLYRRPNQAVQCQHVIYRFTGIPNAPGNLIGVDAVINNLTMNLLQKNELANWKAYEPCVYVATGGYLHAITNKWNLVVHQLADALDAVAHEQGLETGIGTSSRSFAYRRFTQALTLITQHYPVGPAVLSKKLARMPR